MPSRAVLDPTVLVADEKELNFSLNVAVEQIVKNPESLAQRAIQIPSSSLLGPMRAQIRWQIANQFYRILGRNLLVEVFEKSLRDVVIPGTSSARNILEYRFSPFDFSPYESCKPEDATQLRVPAVNPFDANFLASAYKSKALLSGLQVDARSAFVIAKSVRNDDAPLSQKIRSFFNFRLPPGTAFEREKNL